MRRTLDREDRSLQYCLAKTSNSTKQERLGAAATSRSKLDTGVNTVYEPK